jgi:hypothetical protein
MGRALSLKYQQKNAAFFVVERNYSHNAFFLTTNFFRGVSISNQFSDFSKSLMIEFMKSNYYDPYIAHIHPKKAYKVKLKDADKDFILMKRKPI